MPPEKKKRKEKEPVALTADMTNGSSDVTPSKKKVIEFSFVRFPLLGKNKTASEREKLKYQVGFNVVNSI